MDLLRVRSGFGAGEQHPWQRSSPDQGGHLEKHPGLLFQYVLGFACVQSFRLIFFLFQEFALPWDSDHCGSLKVK